MLPWEAYLRHAGSTTRTASERHLYRPVPASVVGRRRRSSLWNAVVTLHHDAQDRWVKSLWSATAFGEFNHAALVHAIGIPVRRSSGMRLRVDRDDVSHPLDEEQLFQAHLVVLQLPVIDSGVRTATDRQQVADLRELAFDAASGGAAFVLVIPALEEEDAVLLITALATRLGKKKPSLDHLLSITEHLRSLLLRPEDPRAAELRELAYDITLFAAETGPLPGGKTTK